MDNLSKVRYTHRDYESLYNDLVSAIPSLTQEWTGREDSDPGIVLIKLMSMLGDNLSYNTDKNVLELFIESVTQRKNCSKLLRLLGYKMHWYRSATIEARMRLTREKDYSENYEHVVLTPFETVFKTASGDVVYTVIGDGPGTGQIDIASSTNYTRVQLVEGLSKKVKFNYNQLVNNRYYFTESNIDENHIWLTFGSSHDFKHVDNLYLVTDDTQGAFEFGVDEYNRPYIELVKYWEDIVGGGSRVTNFSLIYFVSSGAKGNISQNQLIRVAGAGSGTSSPIKEILVITHPGNSTSITDFSYTNAGTTPGYDPESVDKAKLSSANYLFTHDTLVTPSDYEKAVRRVDGITLSKVVDNEIIINENENDPEIVSRVVQEISTRGYDGEGDEGVKTQIEVKQGSEDTIYSFDEVIDVREYPENVPLKFYTTEEVDQSSVKVDADVTPVEGELYTDINTGTRYYYDGDKYLEAVTIDPKFSKIYHEIVGDKNYFYNGEVYVEISNDQGSKSQELLSNNLAIMYMLYRSAASDYEPMNGGRDNSNMYTEQPGRYQFGSYHDYDINPPDESDPLYEAGCFYYKPTSFITTQVNDLIHNLQSINVQVKYGTSKIYPFRVLGTVHLNEPISPQDTLAVVSNIDAALSNYYYPGNNLGYGDMPKFMDIVEVVRSADINIKYFDADSNLIKWSLVCRRDESGNLLGFDSTSFTKYNGLHENFKISEKFLKFRIKNTSYNTIILESLTASRQLGSTDGVDRTVRIPGRSFETIQLYSVDELRLFCNDLSVNTSLSYVR